MSENGEFFMAWWHIFKNTTIGLLVLYFVCSFSPLMPVKYNLFKPRKEFFNKNAFLIKGILYIVLSFALYFIDIKPIVDTLSKDNETEIIIVLAITLLISIFEAVDNIINYIFTRHQIYDNLVKRKYSKFY